MADSKTLVKAEEVAENVSGFLSGFSHLWNPNPEVGGTSLESQGGQQFE